MVLDIQRAQSCSLSWPLERMEDLDLCLLTNAVMLKLYDFAQTMTKSETYFLFDKMLDDVMQCCDHTHLRSHSCCVSKTFSELLRIWRCVVMCSDGKSSIEVLILS